MKSLNVLVIDDIKTVRTILGKILSELGITSIHTSDSLLDSWNILIRELKTSPIDLILCDWNMPKGDGIELLAKLRANEDDKLRLTKFIMITGTNDKVLEAMDKGANNIIHKPFSIETIRAKLELVFGIY
jgi:two-component system chemotaxis response regulator CheY